MYVNSEGQLLKKAEILEIGGTYYLKAKHNEFDPVTVVEVLEDQKVRVREGNQEETVPKNSLYGIDQAIDLNNPPPNDQLVQPPSIRIGHVYYYIEQPGYEPTVVFVIKPSSIDNTKAVVAIGKIPTNIGGIEVDKNKLYSHPQAYDDAPGNNVVINDLPVPMQLDGGRKRRKSVRRRKSKRTRRHSRR